MIQAITFHDNNDSSKNTHDAWGLVASVCPVFSPPKQKTLYIDIPGGNGALDLSEALAGFPVYENRTGTLDFIIHQDYLLEKGDNRPWADRYSEIMGYLHGRVLRTILDDDPNWFYRGRFSVEGWTPGEPFTTVQIGYNLEPYKWSVFTTVDTWLWDPFDFEIGRILDDHIVTKKY